MIIITAIAAHSSAPKTLKMLFSYRKLPQSHSISRQLAMAALSSMAFTYTGCSTTSTTNQPVSGSSPAATASAATKSVSASGLQVVTTFLPITQFTKAVAGDRAQVTQLLPTNVGPHDFQAKPEDAQKLAKADVLVQNGLEMEEFLTDLVKNSGKTNLKIIDSSKGVKTIANEAVEGKGHQHGADHKGEDHKKSEKEEKEHDHGATNPHIWLDPKRAIQQVERIRDGLTAADPAGQEVYKANAAAYVQQLRALDAETTKLLQPYQGKTFVAFHDFAPYFAQSYSLKASFLVDLPESNPAPKDIKRVTDEVKKSSLKAILTEPQAGENAFASLAKDLKVTMSVFDPMETGSAEALEPSYYIKTMRQNVQSLVTAFGGSTQSAWPFWRTPLASDWANTWITSQAVVVTQRIGVGLY
jgi:zinc transport system substrate-binding protein